MGGKYPRLHHMARAETLRTCFKCLSPKRNRERRGNRPDHEGNWNRVLSQSMFHLQVFSLR